MKGREGGRGKEWSEGRGEREGRDEGEGERQLVLTGCFIIRALPFSNYLLSS